MVQFELNVPLTIQGKYKKFPLNLNWYRNAHYYQLNESKIAFKEALREVLVNCPTFHKVSIKYTVYGSSKRKFDISNVCCIVDKYFSDALVESGKLPDDNYENVVLVQYQYGGIDKNNPRVEILIKEAPNS